jgi:hypothetical protein
MVRKKFDIVADKDEPTIPKSNTKMNTACKTPFNTFTIKLIIITG